MSEKILAKARAYLSERGIGNFVPILAEEYKTKILNGIDLVYSIVVMQHLTRDLVRDYFQNLGAKLKPSGDVIVQFVEDFASTQADADLKVYEPSVTWTVRELHELSRAAGLRFVEVRTFEQNPTALWHWVHFKPR